MLSKIFWENESKLMYCIKSSVKILQGCDWLLLGVFLLAQRGTACCVIGWRANQKHWLLRKPTGTLHCKQTASTLYELAGRAYRVLAVRFKYVVKLLFYTLIKRFCMSLTPRVEYFRGKCAIWVILGSFVRCIVPLYTSISMEKGQRNPDLRVLSVLGPDHIGVWVE